jgi:hypothetical protein
VYFSTNFCLVFCFFFLPKRYKSGIKIPDFLQKEKKHKKHKNIVLFSCIRPSLSRLKNFISYFHITKKNPKNVLACILTLITSLLKSREFDQYFKNFKKISCFVLVLGIMNLYVKRIPDIKKVFLLTT